MSGEQVHRVVVVGGGITGLTAALRLAQAARQDAKLVIDVVERAERLGGKIVTHRVDDFLVEGGPDTFLARKPEGIALCRELGLADSLIPTNPEQRRSFVSRRGKLHQLPEGMSGLVPTRIGPLFLSGVLSPLGKLRAAWEPFVPRRVEGEEETVAGFVRRRLGPEAYDYLVEPLLCGIHAGNGEELSLSATAPVLRDMEEEHGSVLRGLRLAGRSVGNELEKFPTPFVSLAGGLQELVDALVRQLDGVNVRTKTAVVALHGGDGAVRVTLSDGEELATAAIIMAVPSFAAAELLEPINPAAAGVLRNIPFVSNAAVALGFRSAEVPRALSGYGYVVPRRERRAVLACSWSSSKLPGRAPDGRVLLRVFLGRAGQEIDDRIDDRQLIHDAREELASVLGISASPLFTRVFRYPKGMPQYTLGHQARLDELDRHMAASPGVKLAGNSYHGVGIPDCIKSGQTAALRALRDIEQLTH